MPQRKSAFAALFLSSVLSFSVVPAQASPNQLCSTNGVAKLSFAGIRAVKFKGDFCAGPEKSIPLAIAGLIRALGEVHRAVAKTVGQSFEDSVGTGVPITFTGIKEGSISTLTLRDGSGISMTAFPDWDLKTWPKKTYAHEFTHFMIYRGGPFANATVGLVDHPFIAEALPDVVALDTFNSPVNTFEDPGLMGCLRLNRDGSPTRSLGESFGNYELFAPSRRLQACCAHFPKRQRGTDIRGFCDFVDSNDGSGLYQAVTSQGGSLHSPTSAELAAPFKPKKCLYRLNGFDILGACNTHELATPMVSFFFSLKRTFGRSFVADWVQILKKQSGLSRTSCRFVHAPEGGVAVELKLRGVASSLFALRDGLTADQKAEFDRLWAAHRFELLEEIDSLYENENRQTLALQPLVTANPRYGGDQFCGSPITVKPRACEVECSDVSSKLE